MMSPPSQKSPNKDTACDVGHVAQRGPIYTMHRRRKTCDIRLISYAYEFKSEQISTLGTGSILPYQNFMLFFSPFYYFFAIFWFEQFKD